LPFSPRSMIPCLSVWFQWWSVPQHASIEGPPAIPRREPAINRRLSWRRIGSMDFARPMRFALMLAAFLCTCTSFAVRAQTAPAPPRADAQQQLTVESLSVVKVRAKAIANARSLRTLGPQREGSGVVIDSEGLVLTIGYLILEAEAVDLLTTDGRSYPATVVGYDNATGFGLLRALRPLPIAPVQIGQSAAVGDRELVL